MNRLKPFSIDILKSLEVKFSKFRSKLKSKNKCDKLFFFFVVGDLYPLTKLKSAINEESLFSCLYSAESSMYHYQTKLG